MSSSSPSKAKPNVDSDDLPNQDGRSTPKESSRETPPVNQRPGSADESNTPSKAVPAPILKQRRWADDIEEDDQFVPIKSGFKRVDPLPRRGTTAAPVPASPKRSSHLKSRQTEPLVNSRRGPAPVRHPVIAPTPSRYSIPVPVVPAGPTAEELEHIATMKDVMAKKAEEKKLRKQEEEARLEQERRARCEAKLREMEERKKAKSPPAEPEVPVPVPVTDSCEKRQAFAKKRLHIREKREGRVIPSPVIETASAGSSTPPPPPVPPAAGRLSATASEFVPMGMPPPPMQWMPHAPYGYAPPPQYYYQPHQQPPPYGYHPQPPFFDHRQQ
jgi:hypothetical protein